MKTRISKSYRGTQHVGWKKTVGGREWFLGYGTDPADEAKALKLAEVLEAKWLLQKAGGQAELTATDFEDVKALIAGQPRHQSARPSVTELVQAAPPVRELPSATSALQAPKPAVAVPTGGVRRWLYASIDEFVANTRRTMRPDQSNADHVFNTCDRVLRARSAIADIPLDLLRRKDLDEWLIAVQGMRSLDKGQPLAAVTTRNHVAGVRAALTKFAEWEWWTPPVLWEKAFKPYTIKKLESPAERKRRKKLPPAHSLLEKRVLWHLAPQFTKAMMALADWAGHTQQEIATMTFDEIQDDGKDMFIDRDRHKTGVPGRWWIPPEAAEVIRKVVARTPRGPLTNPKNLAFLTGKGNPLVHRADNTKRTKSDYVGSSLWKCALLAAQPYGVRHISFKYMRKGTAQLIRNDYGKEVSRSFLAQADEDIQDVHYTRASVSKVEVAVRALYPSLRSIFEPIHAAQWSDIQEQLQKQNSGSAAASGNIAA